MTATLAKEADREDLAEAVRVAVFMRLGEYYPATRLTRWTKRIDDAGDIWLAYNGSDPFKVSPPTFMEYHVGTLRSFVDAVADDVEKSRNASLATGKWGA